MADTTILRSMLRLLLLLTVAVLAAVGSNNKQASLDVSTQTFSTTSRSANNMLNVTEMGEKERKHLSPKDHEVESVKAKDVSWDEDNENEDEEEEEGGEDEGEDEEMDESDTEVDEYEDELREIAESHEAMAKDQRRNGISSTTNSMSSVSKNQSFTSTGFASREKTDEIMSDESSGSNEPMANDDKEVAELLRYKQKATSMVEEKLVGGNSELGTKVKRIPTVKKELSSQKEILNANETQLSLPKTLASDVDVLNRLDDDTKTETRYELPIFSRDVSRYEPFVRDDTSFDEEYSEVEAPGDILRKLDKRQPSELNDLRSYFLDGYNSEQEQRRKLQELGIEEGALTESLMELLSRLAEDPRLWERVQRILADVVGLPSQQEYLVDSQKRDHSSDPLLHIPMTMDGSDVPETPTTTKKPKKKKKKKKKKLRQRLTNATSTSKLVTTTVVTPSPVPPFVPTTTSNWPATTQAQWRLVAERLFAAPWSEEHHETPPSTGQFRLAKEKLPSIDNKQRVSLQTLNDERQALMLQSAREYSQPRRLHYGKVNTHEKGSPNSEQSNIVKSYNAQRNTPIIDYNLDDERSYEHRPISVDPYDRYGHYGRQKMRYYNLSPIDREEGNDYDEVFQPPEDTANHRPFARTQQFRPLGREYASTETWQDSRYDYTRPWKDKARTGMDTIIGSGSNWPWRSSQRDYKIWSPRYQQAWPRDRNYWQRVGDVEEQLEEIMSDDDNDNDVPPINRQKQQQRHQQQNWHMRHVDSGRWPLNRNIDIPSWRLHDRAKSHSRGNLPASLEKDKNRSELNNKEAIVKPVIKDNEALPKITMKTWNSLTSDPATWPFKLNGAKPWPKDKNGNSYNPNAELVRKLGLDKQDRLLSSTKDINGINKEILPEDSRKNKVAESAEIEGDNRNELDPGVNAMKSPNSWSEKLSGIDEWKSRQENNRSPQRDESRQMWRTDLDNERKLWPGQSPVSPKISSVGAWVMPADQSTWRPYDLKHKVYGQVSDEQRWNGPSNPEENNGRSWPTNNKVASGSWPQKVDDWNVAGSVYGPGKSASAGHSSTWPSKWRQFAYHKVTAAPVTKSGSLNVVEGSSRPRNSYIAVSAVSSAKYPNNEWRKNDIEETQLDQNSGEHHDINIDQDDPTSQLRKSPAVTNERWNEKTRIGRVQENDIDKNRNDPLEHQLEELRRGPYWNREQLLGQSQKRSDVNGNSSITFVTTEASRVAEESPSVDNEILKNRVASMTIPESQIQGKKNVTL